MSSLREHIERCEHAVEEPDWAGLRELYPAEVDYKALVKDARDYAGSDEYGGAVLLRETATAVDALLAENEKLCEANADLVEHSKSVHATSYGLAYADAAAAVSFIRYSGHAEYQGHATGDIVEWLRNRGNDLMMRGDNPADALQAERDALRAVIAKLKELEHLSAAPDWPGWNAMNSVWRIIQDAPAIPEGQTA